MAYYSSVDYAYQNDLRNKIDAKNFKFVGKCPNCQTDMRVFTSEDKSIYMCENCGCIYLPENVRNNKLYNYKYKKYKGVFEPVIREATQEQLSYLKTLAYQTETEVDLSSVTKDEAMILISELKTKPWTRTETLIKRYKEWKDMCDTMDEEYAMNHPFIP